MPDVYEFRITGRMSQDLLRTFEPMQTQHEHNETVFIRSVYDAGELFGVISRCEVLGLRLVGLRKVPDGVPPA